MFKLGSQYERRISESIIAVNFKHESAFSLRWKNIEIAPVVIYHCYSLEINRVEQNGNAEGF